MSANSSKILGHFELGDRIGRGGMASVWQATHLPTGTSVAVKIIEGEQAQSDDYRRAFRREVQAMARLEHPAIVRIYDYGLVHDDEHPDSRSARPYLAMELASGGTLRERIEDVDSWATLESILLRILDALAFAHARDLVHRDLKPENILFGESLDDLRLADFGIAFPLDPVREGQDADSERMLSAGTPAYIAPEQATGDWRSFGPWTDLYALGCMSFELLTGRPPYQSDNLVRLISKHVSAPIPSLEPRMACPEGVEAWLHGLLAKRPSERFRSAPHAAERLLELGTGTPVSFVPGGPAPAELADTEVISETLPMLGTPFRTTDVDAATRTEVLDAEATGVDRADETPASESRPQREFSLPDDWRRPDLRSDHGAFVSGLGLFGLREVPYVGRDAARDTLWRILGDVIADETPHAALITGPAGIGKSRLSEWLTRRVRELDVAEVLRVHHDPDDSPGAGMARLLTRHFRIWGLDEDAARSRIRARLEFLSPNADPGLLDHDTRRLLQIARPTVDLARHTDRRDLLASLKRWFAGTAAQKPMIILFDDAQWATESLELTLAVLEAGQNHRVMALVTARDQELSGPRADLFARLTASDRTSQLELNALEDAERRQLARAVLPLEDELVDRVASRTSGHPLFTVHLVSAWVEEQALSATENGYTLVQGEGAIPNSAAAICRRRLDNLIDAAPENRREERRRAIELAACLGTEPRRQDWERTLSAAGLSVDADALAARLTERGIARPTERDWRFAHAAFRTAALSLSDEAGRTKENHLYCARALESAPDADEGRSFRVARHWMAADQYEAALEPALEAFRSARYAGHWDRAREFLDMHRRAAEALGYPDDHPVALKNVVERAHTCVDRGDLAEAGELLREISERIEAAPAELRGEYHVVYGSLKLFNGLPSEALGHFERAEELAGENLVELGHVLTWKADCLRILGRLEDALAVALRAASLVDPSEHFEVVTSALASAGYLANQLGRTDEAERHVERALEHWNDEPNAPEFDLAELWNVLGEVERVRGNYQEALTHYRRGRLLFERCSAFGQLSVMDINIGIALVELEQWDEAAEILVDAADTLEGMRDFAPSVMARVVAGVALAALGDWQRWDDDVTPGLEWLLEHEIVERENAEYAEIAARKARAAGQESRAALAEKVAESQRRRLERSREAAP